MTLYSYVFWLTILPYVQSKGKSCLFPELPKYTKSISQEQDSYEENSIFYYRCAESYHFERNANHHKIVCDDGQWQPINIWRCFDACNNTCGDHGNCVKTLGDKATDETSTLCRCDKNYAGKHCDARVCESEPVGPHHRHPYLERGKPVNEKYPLGSVLRYRCVDNYVIKSGPARASCESHGWVPSTVPVCEVNSCQRPPSDSNGKYFPMLNVYVPGKKLHLTCDSGYEVDGERELECSSGKWSSKWPSCQRKMVGIQCGEPPIVKHALILQRSHIRQDRETVAYQCQKPYAMIGSRTISCPSKDNEPKWDTPPRCDLTCAVMRKRGDKYHCEHVITTTVTSTVKPLTIVTATAGALLLLLLIVISLVAYQRRRIAINSRRQGRERLTNEDDRYSFVYYSNDVHVVLPSYDEAMRVQGAPPPYHSESVSVNSARLENISNDSARPDGLPISNCHQTGTEVIYDAIDDTLLAANIIQGQPNINELQSGSNFIASLTGEINEVGNTSTDRNNSNISHKCDSDTGNIVNNVENRGLTREYIDNRNYRENTDNRDNNIDSRVNVESVISYDNQSIGSASSFSSDTARLIDG